MKFKTIVKTVTTISSALTLIAISISISALNKEAKNAEKSQDDNENNLKDETHAE